MAGGCSRLHILRNGVWLACRFADRQASRRCGRCRGGEAQGNFRQTGTEGFTVRYCRKEGAQRRVRVADGKEGIAKQSLDLKVSKPHRWNLDNPYLYTLKTELLANGKRIDGSETKVGLRTLEFDANKGFALNGNWMKVKGVCLHHDAGIVGTA